MLLILSDNFLHFFFGVCTNHIGAIVNILVHLMFHTIVIWYANLQESLNQLLLIHQLREDGNFNGEDLLYRKPESLNPFITKQGFIGVIKVCQVN